MSIYFTQGPALRFQGVRTLLCQCYFGKSLSKVWRTHSVRDSSGCFFDDAICPPPDPTRMMKHKVEQRLGPYTRCTLSPRRSEFKCQSNLVKKMRVRFSDDCFEGECRGYNSPLDKDHYRASDTYSRIYQQTWNECKPIQKPAKCCAIEYPEFERWKPNLMTRTRSMSCPPGLAGSCEFNSPKKQMCKRVTMPGCAEIRSSTSCKRVREKKECHRVQTRYPAYSECDIEKPEPLPLTECTCLNKVPLCVIMEAFLHRHSKHRSPCKPRV